MAQQLFDEAFLAQGEVTPVGAVGHPQSPGGGLVYQLTGFTNVLSRLAVGVRGEWNFNPDGDGTLIRWTYEFKPLPGRRWILAGPFAPLWRRYMVAAIERCLQLVESEEENS